MFVDCFQARSRCTETGPAHEVRACAAGSDVPHTAGAVQGLHELSDRGQPHQRLQRQQPTQGFLCLLQGQKYSLKLVTELNFIAFNN